MPNGILASMPRNLSACRAHYEKAIKRLPLGVTSNFRYWGEKTLYGRKYMGMERATFLVNAKGVIVEAWRKVKVPGHVEAVLEAAREAAKAA